MIVLAVFLAAGCQAANQNTSNQPSAGSILTNPATQSATTSPSSTPSGIRPPPVTQVSLKIFKLSPSAGPVGTTVTVTGQGFTKTGNQIYFGQGMGRHRPDGTQDNMIATVDSPGGTTLTFIIPQTGPSGILCDSQNRCIAVTAIRRLPGTYQMAIENKNGASNTVTFTIQ